MENQCWQSEILVVDKGKLNESNAVRATAAEYHQNLQYCRIRFSICPPLFQTIYILLEIPQISAKHSMYLYLFCMCSKIFNKISITGKQDACICVWAMRHVTFIHIQCRILKAAWIRNIHSTRILVEWNTLKRILCVAQRFNFGSIYVCWFPSHAIPVKLSRKKINNEKSIDIDSCVRHYSTLTAPAIISNIWIVENEVLATTIHWSLKCSIDVLLFCIQVHTPFFRFVQA